MKEIANKEDLAQARATASQIRQGIHNYLATLALIAKANKERHWKVLGYSDWQSYVDGEFGAERLRLPAEHRAKAVQELRLAGLSTRAIAPAVGASEATVRRDLSGASFDAPEETTGIDGKTYAASRPSQPAPPPVEADAQLVDDGARTTDAREAETGTGMPVEVGDGVEGHAIPSTPQAAPVSAPRGVDTGVNPSDLVNAVLDKHVPDPNPHREWQRRYFEAIAGVHKVMRFAPEDVAEKADEECIDELVRVFEQLDDYRTRVIEARMSNAPNNVRHLRRIS